MFLHNILEENILKSLVKVLMTKGLSLLSKYHLLNEQINLEIFPPMKSIPLTSHDYRENEITTHESAYHYVADAQKLDLKCMNCWLSKM